VNGEYKIGDGAAVQTLLTERDFCIALGVSERKFKELRAAGLVPEPLALGPRVARWTSQDYAETLQRMPRRQRAAEPATLAEGRRARINRIKAA
jgi:hypothetical protein